MGMRNSAIGVSTRLASWGWSKTNGEYDARGWPDWITIPSFRISPMRGAGISRSPGSWRSTAPFIWPGASDRAIFRGILFRPRRTFGPSCSSVLQHIKLKHPVGAAAKRYNPLQRLAYLGVIVLISLMASWLTMSPLRIGQGLPLAS